MVTGAGVKIMGKSIMGHVSGEIKRGKATQDTEGKDRKLLLNPGLERKSVQGLKEGLGILWPASNWNMLVGYQRQALFSGSAIPVKFSPKGETRETLSCCL